MDFPQQIEETLVERPESVYDVIMESPLYSATMERKVQAAMSNKVVSSSASNNKLEADKMSSSLNSTLEDTTPSDSGIQMLDSESSEFMIESITSQTGFEFEETQKTFVQEKEIEAVLQASAKEASKCTPVQIASSVDTNSNVTTTEQPVQPTAPAPPPGVEEAMSASACSTFDTTENIVYRRKVRKTPSASKAPKKRVSFHEDILKNTRTDNIHIEHGFVTYKNGRKIHAPHVGVAGRYSWCSEGDRGGAANVAATTELCTQSHDEDDAQGRPRRCVVYRNACSDVLDYGNSDFYDTNESNYLQYDNSGVFEYLPKEVAATAAADTQAKNADGQVFYRCSCSSSNSSLDSDENDKNSNRQEYGQAKSSSCDCIGMSNANNNLIGENCYFSEPNIDNLNEKKSVWNKEKKPKSSCLKKTKRHTNIIYEQDLTTKVKKFNVHEINTLIDNSSKMIFGSLKSIFTMPLPERGVPEGSEDLQAVIECVPELEQTPEHKPRPTHEQAAVFAPESPPLKQKPFLSKSLDGSKQQQGVKKFVHNVDEQLRRKNDEELYTPTRQNSEIAPQKTATLQRQDEIDGDVPSEAAAATSTPHVEQKQFRNKFIINCESTVFEHTGVSYCFEMQNKFNNQLENVQDAQVNVAAAGVSIGKDTPMAIQPETEQIHSSSSFISTPLAKTFSNFFRSFKEPSTSPPTATIVNKKLAKEMEMKTQQQATDSYFALKMNKKPCETPSDNHTPKQVLKILTTTTSSSTISDLTTSTNSSLPPQKSNTSIFSSTSSTSLALGGHDLRTNLDKQSRHLPSPLKKRASGGNLIVQPQRYGVVGSTGASMPDNNSSYLSPDVFNSGYSSARGGSGRDSKSTILSEEFDDILTITTDTDKNESDIVIVDYPELSDRQDAADYANLLKPPQPPTAKTSLINRFLRNVTQKKILESSIRKNNFFAGKLKNEQKLFTGHLYVPGMKPKNYDLIDDLNAEIAMEIEMSGANSPRRELASIEADMPGDTSHFELGIGEISIDIFNGNYLHILRDATELLMKVFKLYTGYSREGFMTPVLVFLTDKTLYVTDLVRNRLCTKFVLAYTDLDVILMGPYGNTVLLSNSARDMQQVLLAGGPYPADGLVANLELCARRSGSTLPAVGQLTLQHLAPLRAFVHENSCVGKNDTWMYYAVVNVPAGSLGSEQEPLGPHVKGFLMHRRVKDYAGNARQCWNPGYFLLKAGVLYMFNDSSQKLPSWAMALAECQGARRAVKAGRPHCFEILLKGQLLQLAAPDEYVASEWLQALLQSASGLFEMQEKHKTLGCTLVVTQNHLITLREDFAGPLRQINRNSLKLEDTNNTNPNANLKIMDEDNLALPDTGSHSVLSSAMSTPSKGTQRSCSSVNSTPTKLSQLSRSTNASNNTITCTTTASTTSVTTSSNTTCSKQTFAEGKESYSNMSSVYGKNSGLEILTCADIKEMTGIKIPSHNDTWWCILEFSCQEVRECSDDLAIFFASSSEMQRFLRLLEQLWQAKNNDLFPITILDEDDLIAEQCTVLYMDINRAWEPLLSSALGYPL